jgi:hypothetical protein
VDTNDQGRPVDRNAQVLGFWVAGDIPAVGELPFDGSATYSGGAVGTVHTDLFGEDTTYTARGDMDMRWDFGSRSGDMKISKFDQDHFEGGLTFKGEMCAPGKANCSTPQGNHFGGKLNGQLPGAWQNGDANGEINQSAEYRDLNGFAVGSFARGPDNYDNGDPKTGTPIPGSKPQGVMGNWEVGNDHYQASGVFAGSRQR